jgi:hypothetical protein
MSVLDESPLSVVYYGGLNVPLRQRRAPRSPAAGQDVVHDLLPSIFHLPRNAMHQPDVPGQLKPQRLGFLFNY